MKSFHKPKHITRFGSPLMDDMCHLVDKFLCAFQNLIFFVSNNSNFDFWLTVGSHVHCLPHCLVENLSFRLNRVFCPWNHVLLFLSCYSLKNIFFNFNSVKPVTNPGFLRRKKGTIPKRVPTYYSANFFPQTLSKWKKRVESPKRLLESANAVEGPGFPREWVPTPEGCAQTYYFAKFLPKTAWKWKNLDWRDATCSRFGSAIAMQALTRNVWFRYRSGTVNSKSFVGKVFLRIKRKFELTYPL